MHGVWRIDKIGKSYYILPQVFLNHLPGNNLDPLSAFRSHCGGFLLRYRLHAVGEGPQMDGLLRSGNDTFCQSA